MTDPVTVPERAPEDVPDFDHPRAEAAIREMYAPLLADANTFEALGIGPRLVEELGRMGVTRPTAIQKSVLPHMLSAGDKDAFVQAETGSGKTFSYLLPIVQRVLAVSEVEAAGARPARPVARTRGRPAAARPR